MKAGAETGNNTPNQPSSVDTEAANTSKQSITHTFYKSRMDGTNEHEKDGANNNTKRFVQLVPIQHLFSDLVRYEFYYSQNTGQLDKRKKPHLKPTFLPSSVPTRTELVEEINEFVQRSNDQIDGNGLSKVNAQVNQRVMDDLAKLKKTVNDLVASHNEWIQARNEEPASQKKDAALFSRRLDDHEKSLRQLILFKTREPPQITKFEEYVEADRQLIFQSLSRETGGFFTVERLIVMVQSVKRLAPKSRELTASKERSEKWSRPVLVTFHTAHDRNEFMKICKAVDSKNVNPGRSPSQRLLAKKLQQECDVENALRTGEQEMAFRWVVSSAGNRKYLLLDKTSKLYVNASIADPEFEGLRHKEKVNVVLRLQMTMKALQERELERNGGARATLMTEFASPNTDVSHAPGWTMTSAGEHRLMNAKDITAEEKRKIEDVVRNAGSGSSGLQKHLTKKPPPNGVDIDEPPETD